MTEIDLITTKVLHWISEQNSILIWMFFFISNLTENIFPPWPGDTVTVIGGFLVAQKRNIGWGLILSSTFFGNLFGGFLMYKFGKTAIHWMHSNNFPFKKSIYNETNLQKTFDWFSNNNVWVIVLSRFSAGIRFFVSIVAGMSKMPISHFLFYFSIAIAIWCGLLIGGGFYLGKNWELILKILTIYNRVVMVAIGLIFFIIVFVKFQKKF
ncbi:MAG: DedA family protein [Leptospiraceae bacterium]|nr:DedA family protein [Leptospiraceae bacterium]MCK6382572.1 DedA family protein [Leptospiraceae bacterium]NUM42123.1 DedA family protein [Leptospiraceae bacterium]